jgi:site-specific recombinase XerD
MLSALHAFFRYTATRLPHRLAHCQQILVIPFKRARQRTIEYLEYEEIQQILYAVDKSTPDGRRDYALLAILFNTGARVQETLDLPFEDNVDPSGTTTARSSIGLKDCDTPSVMWSWLYQNACPAEFEDKQLHITEFST